jgi:hypothetical protein
MKPAIPLHDSRFKYVPAAQTNVLATWRRFGFVPPTEANPDYFKTIKQELNGVTD